MYYILMIIALLITMGADAYLRLVYKKCDKILNKKEISGEKAARTILDKNDLSNVKIDYIKGNLTDHYDPKAKTVRLSAANYTDSTISAVAVAAHECGHAIQDKNGYFFLRLRHSILPFVNIASKAGYVAILIGLFSGLLNIIWFGIFCECFILLFQLITLPVEFNASSRALKQLVDLGLIEKDELPNCRKMLTAAALTYVAGVASAVLEIFRLLLMFTRRD